MNMQWCSYTRAYPGTGPGKKCACPGKRTSPTVTSYQMGVAIMLNYANCDLVAR